jgi:hypothetical protein
MRFAEPVIDPDDAPMPDGEVVAAPLPSGRTLTVAFVSPYEPWFALDGQRISQERCGDDRGVLLWGSRRLTALYRALDVSRGIRATLTAGGSIVVTDVINLDDGEPLDHNALLATLEGAQVRPLDFAALGPTSSRTELVQRVRGLYAVGTLLEVRVEDGCKVLTRRRWRVGR